MNIAASLTSLAEDILRMPMPVRLRAWDGSEAGPPDGPVLVIRDKRAVRHLMWQPGELGIARAYVQGHLDVDGDLADGLRAAWAAVRAARAADPAAGRPRIRSRHVVRGLFLVIRLGLVGRRPPLPAAEAALSGERHSRERDAAAIEHHYDLSNDFYALILDETMAYSAGFYADPDADLHAAQRAKLDLICRKLGLEPGMRLLDIGSGWGSLSLHAAEYYGAEVTGVTLSGEQCDFVRRRAAERGIADRVDVRVCHFRDVEELGIGPGSVDAVASVEMGEHVGDAEYRILAETIHRVLAPGGRAVIQQMSRSNSRAGDRPGGGPFIETYIAPDMHMKPLPTTLARLAEPGMEIRDVAAMREHYPATVAGWAANLEKRWDEAVALIGEETARVWRLYFAGGSLAFEENRMGVDQILLVKPDDAGASGMPWSPEAWLP